MVINCQSRICGDFQESWHLPSLHSSNSCPTSFHFCYWMFLPFGSYMDCHHTMLGLSQSSIFEQSMVSRRENSHLLTFLHDNWVRLQLSLSPWNCGLIIFSAVLPSSDSTAHEVHNRQDRHKASIEHYSIVIGDNFGIADHSTIWSVSGSLLVVQWSWMWSEGREGEVFWASW